MLHKTVLITGASRGIGKATATIFAQSGYHLVLICYTSIKELEEFAQELRRIWNISVHTFSVDLSDSSNIKELFEIQMPSKGVPPIDILINNAGISHIGLFTQLSEPKLLEILHTNLISTMLCSQYVLPHMIQIQSGRIINISSVWGNVGASMEVAYSTSKAGLNGFTRALAKEVAPSNIQVNGIACGMIHTHMNASFTNEEIDHIIEEIPANRIGDSTEVGEFIYLLATSPTYLTGQVIPFDGGWI